MDPRLAEDGVTQADLETQLELSLKVVDAISEARLLVSQIAEERERVTGRRSDELDEIFRRLVRAPGKYPQRMLLDQLEYLYEVITTADFLPSNEAFGRHTELRAELDQLVASVRRREHYSRPCSR
jgi:hypothetical protein